MNSTNVDEKINAKKNGFIDLQMDAYACGEELRCFITITFYCQFNIEITCNKKKRGAIKTCHNRTSRLDTY